MKTLLLMRHAKSSWKDSDLADHERPLNKRGKKDAPMMGHLVKEQKLVPQRIISSSAIRSRQTAESIAETSGFMGDIVLLDRLYMAEAEEYMDVLHQLPDDINQVMVIGHNPGLETLLQVLSGRIEALPTAVLAHIEIPIDHWSELNGQVLGEITKIWRPREVKKGDGDKEKDKDKGKKKK